jgi:PAS domain S-box-containing protein
MKNVHEGPASESNLLQAGIIKSLLDSIPDMVFYKDLNGVYLGCNAAFARQLGRNETEVTGRTDYDFYCPEEADGYREGDRMTLIGRTPRHIEDWMRWPDGSLRLIDTIKSPLLSGDGTLIGVVGVCRDVTEIKQAEEEALKAKAKAQESEERYRALVTNSLEGIIILDLDGTVLFVNQAAARAMEVADPDWIIGRKVFEFVAPESLGKVAEDFANVLSGIDSYVSEYRLITPTGRDIWIESIGKIIQYDGKPVDLISLRNVTRRKEADAERENLQRQLIQAQKLESVGRLAGGVAHDFNNMLGVIIGHTEMALEQLEPGQLVYADLQEVRKAAERSAGLTRQLLAFARKQTVAPRVLDLNETVEGMLKMLRRLIGENIDLVWQPGPMTGRVKIDPSQVDQLLANLCVNARDAISGTGCITISTRCILLEETALAGQAGPLPGDYVAITVEDNGCGMDSETLARIFDPFFTTKEVGKGTGLGLAMVYGIVKQNGGSIAVKSEPGKGTSFCLYIPRHQEAAETKGPGGLAACGAGGGEIILLVEDEPAILKMTGMILERLGYRVLAAASPGEGLRLAETHAGSIDLLMTDVVMPEMNGRDLARTLLGRYPNIKRLFMSGYTADVIAHQGVLDPGVHFIQKPFTMKDLADKIRFVLDV